MVREIFYVDFMKKHLMAPTVSFDVFVDDSLEEALLLTQSVPKVLLFDHPWNHGCLNVFGVFERVFTWKDVTRILEGLSREHLAGSAASNYDRNRTVRAQRQ